MREGVKFLPGRSSGCQDPLPSAPACQRAEGDTAPHGTSQRQQRSLGWSSQLAVAVIEGSVTTRAPRVPRVPTFLSKYMDLGLPNKVLRARACAVCFWESPPCPLHQEGGRQSSSNARDVAAVLSELLWHLSPNRASRVSPQIQNMEF